METCFSVHIRQHIALLDIPILSNNIFTLSIAHVVCKQAGPELAIRFL